MTRIAVGAISRVVGGRDMADDGVDFVLAAYREEGSWQVELLPDHVAGNLDELLAVLRQRPGDGGAVGFVSVDDDFFVAVRVTGTDARLLLSDVTAASEWPLARAVVERLDLPLPGDEERVQPAGDLTIFADLGVESIAMAAICDNLDLYPDDMLQELAERMGFGDEYARVLESTIN